MKLTKKQATDLFNCHIGTGFIVFKTRESEIKSIEFFVSPKFGIGIINNSVPADRIDLNKFVLDNVEQEHNEP